MAPSVKKTARLPYSFYFHPALFFILAGTGSCIYLANVHFRNYVDLNFASICAISKAINCDTVAQSPYSIIFNLPLAHWGIFCFLGLGLIVSNTRGQSRLHLWWLIFLIGLASSLISIYYGYIAAFKIQSYCIFCLTCYLCFFCITFLSFIIIRRFQINFNIAKIRQSASAFFFPKANFWLILLFCSSLIVLKLTLPQYWKFIPTTVRNSITIGVTKDGHPWIGANKPLITIEEYTDYQCFQCRKMHFFLRHLVDEHPNILRIVHHNYPMDHEFNPLVKKPLHVGAGYMAILANYAATQDKFWEVNDELFRQVRAGNDNVLDLQELSKRSDIPMQNFKTALNDTALRYRLAKEIQDGLQLRITGTPAYVIDNQVYVGSIPQHILKKLSP